jgi:hypothetical protein
VWSDFASGNRVFVPIKAEDASNLFFMAFILCIALKFQDGMNHNYKEEKLIKK